MDLKQNYNPKRESHISLSWFSCGLSILVELEFGDVGFCGGRKTGKPGETPPSTPPAQGERTTYGTGLESNPGHIGGRRNTAPYLLPNTQKAFF